MHYTPSFPCLFPSLPYTLMNFFEFRNYRLSEESYDRLLANRPPSTADTHPMFVAKIHGCTAEVDQVLKESSPGRVTHMYVEYGSQDCVSHVMERVADIIRVPSLRWVSCYIYSFSFPSFDRYPFRCLFVTVICSLQSLV